MNILLPRTRRLVAPSRGRCCVVSVVLSVDTASNIFGHLEGRTRVDGVGAEVGDEEGRDESPSRKRLLPYRD